jgi:hypothetical protein
VHHVKIINIRNYGNHEIRQKEESNGGKSCRVVVEEMGDGRT